MTSALDSFRKQMGAVRPGHWRADDGSVVTDAPGYSPCVASYVEDEDAAGIVTAVRLSQFLAGEEVAAKLAEIIFEYIDVDRADEADAAGRTICVNIIRGEKEAARAIIALLAGVAVGGTET